LRTTRRVPIYDAGACQSQVQERIVLVKVERIRRGRRLPEVDYVEVRSRRRPQEEGQAADGSRAAERIAEADHSRAKLRLPWQINHRSQ